MPGGTGFAGVIVAGGAARRLGGVDKPMLEVGGRTLLDRSLAAVTAGRRVATTVVVVGPRRSGVDRGPGHGGAGTRLRWVREDPPGSGPAAALAAGLSIVDEPVVVVLAGDLLGVRPPTVERLLDTLESRRGLDGAVLVDTGGRRQWLLGAWRTAAVRGAMPAEPANTSLRGVLGGLRIAEVPALPGEDADVDTPGDL